MPSPATSATVPRRPRADAQRNRERILDVARAAFAEHGAAATMDDITRRAVVGAGTLYRHFPTREALIEAVFRDHVDRLTAAGERFARSLPPVEALRAWMLEFIDYVADKLLIMPAMDTVPGGSSRLIEGSRKSVHGAFQKLVQEAIASGELRADTHPDDFMMAMIGVFHATATPGWEASARRIVDILIAGSRSAPRSQKSPREK